MEFQLGAYTPELQTLTEISTLDAAFKGYKEKYGSYPPSDFSNLDDSQSPQYIALASHIANAFPRSDENTEMTAIRKLRIKSPAQALCFWLGGFCSDPTRPVSGLADPRAGVRNPPFFPFDGGRLKYPVGANSIPIYVPRVNEDSPYIYFSAVSYATQPPFTASLKQGGKEIARPYRADKQTGGSLFVNPNSFQIIAAGVDGDFGGGAGSFPSGAGYESGDMDNLTNFSSSRPLGDVIPK